MIYKHPQLGTFTADISGIDYANLTANTSVQQIQKDLDKINKAQAVTFYKSDDNGPVDLKRASYLKIRAEVLLTPGYDRVVFEGEKIGEGNEGLSRYAETQLKDMLEDNLIIFSKRHLEDIRAEAKTAYLDYVKAKFLEMQDKIRAGLSVVYSYQDNADKPRLGLNWGGSGTGKALHTELLPA